MLDGMRDRIAFVLICLVFVRIAPSNLVALNCYCFCRYDDGAYGTRKFKALKYYKA